MNYTNAVAFLRLHAPTRSHEQRREFQAAADLLAAHSRVDRGEWAGPSLVEVLAVNEMVEDVRAAVDENLLVAQPATGSGEIPVTEQEEDAWSAKDMADQIGGEREPLRVVRSEAHRQPTPLERTHAPDGDDFVMDATGHRHVLPLCRCNHGKNYHEAVTIQADIGGFTGCSLMRCDCRQYEPVGGAPDAA